MPDIVGCPTYSELNAALETTRKAEKFLAERAKEAGLPINYVSLHLTGMGTVGITLDSYSRLFKNSLSGRRDLTRETIYSFADFDRVVDEAVAAFKTKKQR